MSTEQEIEYFDRRITELILLNSMYPNQLILHNSSLQQSIECEDVSRKYEDSISGIFQQEKGNGSTNLEIQFTLFEGVRASLPNVSCRIVDDSINNNRLRLKQKQLNEQIISQLDSEESLIEIIQTILKLWQSFNVEESEDENGNETKNEPFIQIEDEKWSRYWIISHHIKSKTKRKSIIEHCEELQLNGFMLIGKPGIICFEGPQTDCESVWSIIRRWQWQQIRLIEKETIENKINSFESFQEYIDRSKVFNILKSKNCDSVIRSYLGL